MTSNETTQASAYKTGEYAITKQDLTKAALSIGALGMEFLRNTNIIVKTGFLHDYNQNIPPTLGL